MVSLTQYYLDMKPTTKIKVSFILVVIIFTLILSLYALGYQTNRNRISDLQTSRVSSCQNTYSSIPGLAAPFLPKEPLTIYEANQLRLFYEHVDTLVAGCVLQVKP